MGDELLTVIALIIELGLPIAALVGLSRPDPARRISLSVLGATSPFLALYAIIGLAHIAGVGGDASWAVLAMWVMTLTPYLAAVSLGLLISLSDWPKAPIARYATSFVGSLVALGALVGVGNAI